MKIRDRHPLNVEGDFYVENGMCVCCDAAPSEAPSLLGYDKDSHCYFVRQPQTPEELQNAISACLVSEMCAVRYAGEDIETLVKIGRDSCDYFG